MTFARMMTSAILASLFAVSAQAQTEVSAGTLSQESSEIAKTLEQAVRECGPTTRTSVWSYRDGLQVMYMNDKTSCAYFVVKAQFQLSKCKGINTFALALDGASLAHGEFKNLQGRRLADLFGDYQGSAFGLGFFAGSGRWQAQKENGVTYGGKRVAIPVPIGGGDIALGYTSCDFSSQISPLGSVELKALGYYNRGPFKMLNVNDVAHFPLF
ncbi:MAG: hypothetical protein KF789_14525 [Bdellovibrionaceae bacterium]|nr:hypothetical protein [Pseudobdellovibrionaceae bacterium]